MSLHRSLSLGVACFIVGTLSWAGCSSGGGGTSSGSGSGSGSGGSSSSSGGSGGSSGSGSGGADASSGSSGSGSSSGAGSSSGSSGGSSGSSGGGSGGSSGGSSGSSSGSSSGGDAGSNCPTVPCASGETCCADLTNDTAYCAASCPSNDTIQCKGPADCSGATPDCCATDVLDGMDAGASFPHCYAASLSTQCVAQCVSHIQVSCTATETLHVCAGKSDCAADVANPDCCLVAGFHVCVSTLLSALGGLTCLP